MKRFNLRMLRATGLAAAMMPLFGQSCTIDVDGFVRPRSFSGVIDVFIDDDDDFFDDLEDFFDDLEDEFDDDWF